MGDHLRIGLYHQLPGEAQMVPGPGDNLSVGWYTDSEFSGLWSADQGPMIESLLDPADYFCARRVGTDH